MYILFSMLHISWKQNYYTAQHKMSFLIEMDFIGYQFMFYNLLKIPNKFTNSNFSLLFNKTVCIYIQSSFIRYVAFVSHRFIAGAHWKMPKRGPDDLLQIHIANFKGMFLVLFIYRILHLHIKV